MYGYDLQLLPFCAAKLGLRLIESDCSCSSHTLCRERLYRNFLRRNDSCQWQLQMLHSHLYTSMHIRSFLRGTTIAGCTSSCRCCRRTSSGRKKAWRGEKWWRILGHTLHLHVPPRAVWVGLCWLCIGTSKPVVQYHIMFVVLVHVVLLWHRCSVNPSPLQISFSPPYDMAAIHKHKSERNAFLNSLGHEKWMSRILKITYYVYIACAIDSHWIIICIYIYMNVSLSLHLRRIIHAACHWPQMNENMDENSIRGSSEAMLRYIACQENPGNPWSHVPKYPNNGAKPWKPDERVKCSELGKQLIEPILFVGLSMLAYRVSIYSSSCLEKHVSQSFSEAVGNEWWTQFTE